MKRWNFVQDLTQSTSGVGGVYVMMPLLLASDYEDNQVQQKERVVIDVVQLRMKHFMTPQVANSTAFTALFTLATMDLDTAATIAGNNDGAWSPGAATFEEERSQLIRTFGYSMHAGAVPSAAAVGVYYTDTHRISYKSWRVKLRMQEPVGLYLILQGQGFGTNQVSSLEMSYRLKMRSW